jgi:hypothetical protein
MCSSAMPAQVRGGCTAHLQSYLPGVPNARRHVSGSQAATSQLPAGSGAAHVSGCWASGGQACQALPQQLVVGLQVLHRPQQVAAVMLCGRAHTLQPCKPASSGTKARQLEASHCAATNDTLAATVSLGAYSAGARVPGFSRLPVRGRCQLATAASQPPMPSGQPGELPALLAACNDTVQL